LGSGLSLYLDFYLALFGFLIATVVSIDKRASNYLYFVERVIRDVLEHG